jgi:murein DD-endopeptidase MepM/ murein hydrolase activator NlpD
VQRGDVLGLLGNSGQSSAPHLHFHVTEGPSLLGANGVPYAFDRVRVRKARLVPLTGTNFRVETLSDPPREVVLELVLNDDLLDFGPP